MKATHPLLALSFLLCATAAHAQLYKWVGPDGKVVYSDTPPPSSVKKVESKTGVGGGDGTPLPFEVATAARNNPVTLYSAPGCGPCDLGRKLLNTRGVPFTEKTVVTNEDIAKMRALGASQLPYLTVGRNKLDNFHAAVWGDALTAAGYPEANKLPPGYRNPAPQSLAPSAATPAVAQNANGGAEAPAASEALPAPVGNAPPGFRF
jgi:glutaredoxin